MLIPITKHFAKLNNCVAKLKSKFAFNHLCLQNVFGQARLVATTGTALVTIPVNVELIDSRLIPTEAIKIKSANGKLELTERKITVFDGSGERSYPVPTDSVTIFPEVDAVFPKVEPMASARVNIRVVIDALTALLANEDNPADPTARDGFITCDIQMLKGKGLYATSVASLVFTYGQAKALVMGISTVYPSSIPK